VISTRSRRDGSAASAGVLEADTYPSPIESRDHLAEPGPVATSGSTMPIELDPWDRDWLSRAHTPAEYQRQCKELMERCAHYAATIETLRAALAERKETFADFLVRRSWDAHRAALAKPEPAPALLCRYPACADDGGRCARLFAGECAGPRDGGR
jgi:hypothetical protein